ncbi:hypothetical protein LX32DRAFT_368255 [Colletotrichum zoysiae]|uniref:Uncharacterized protein n=1 Tax=Colletotrichum zoysiae TaxID=1216348 RepID=A0AAD9M782_9PEZI|nr:hypothetical protein LX32DRAFT_368255 [Colletotrichum zoysiae]
MWRRGHRCRTTTYPERTRKTPREFCSELSANLPIYLPLCIYIPIVAYSFSRVPHHRPSTALFEQTILHRTLLPARQQRGGGVRVIGRPEQWDFLNSSPSFGIYPCSQITPLPPLLRVDPEDFLTGLRNFSAVARLRRERDSRAVGGKKRRRRTKNTCVVTASLITRACKIDRSVVNDRWGRLPVLERLSKSKPTYPN